jgi:hypothetical protein
MVETRGQISTFDILILKTHFRQADTGVSLAESFDAGDDAAEKG